MQQDVIQGPKAAASSNSMQSRVGSSEPPFRLSAADEICSTGSRDGRSESVPVSLPLTRAAVYTGPQGQ